MTAIQSRGARIAREAWKSCGRRGVRTVENTSAVELSKVWLQVQASLELQAVGEVALERQLQAVVVGIAVRLERVMLVHETGVGVRRSTALTLHGLPKLVESVRQRVEVAA